MYGREEAEIIAESLGEAAVPNTSILSKMHKKCIFTETNFFSFHGCPYNREVWHAHHRSR
jgi:hypothetical protein